MSAELEDHDPTQGKWLTPADMLVRAQQELDLLPKDYTIGDLIRMHLFEINEEDNPNIIRSTN